MKRSLVFSSLLIMAACSSNDKDSHTAVTTDTTATVSTPAPPVMPVERPDPFTSVGQFNADFYSPAHDSMIAALKKDPALVVVNNPELIAGDATYKYLWLKDPAAQSSLFIKETSVGEYGNSFEEYYTVNNNIVSAHTYDLGAAEDGDGFILKEMIYDFRDNGVIVKSRQKRSKYSGDQNLNGKPYKIQPGGDRKKMMDMLSKNLAADTLEIRKKSS